MLAVAEGRKRRITRSAIIHVVAVVYVRRVWVIVFRVIALEGNVDMISGAVGLTPESVGYLERSAEMEESCQEDQTGEAGFHSCGRALCVRAGRSSESVDFEGRLEEKRPCSAPFYIQRATQKS
jgi:hypothetical protein